MYGAPIVRRAVGLAVANAALIALLWCSTAAEARDAFVGSFDGTQIAAHFYPAVGLDPGERAPTVLIGPGWATVGDTSPDANMGDRIGTSNLRNDGYNVVTWDPRGFGGSGGVSTFDAPAFEGRDVSALVDYVAAQPEARLDAAGDPRVGMSGSSYGGAIQLVAAAIDQRLDAIVPDVAWESLLDGVAKDGAFKAGWWLSLCAYGEVFGLTAFPPGPAIQLGSVDAAFRTMCLEGSGLGKLSAASTQWVESRGPGALVGNVRAPTLLMQGTPDTLFGLDQAIATYAALRANHVPAKMLWYCGGHGTCATPAGDPAVLSQAGLSWLRRWLKGDTSVDTGPRVEWLDDGGTWRSAADYPLAPAGTMAGSGSGTVALTPTVAATLGPYVVATPSAGALDVAYAAPPGETDIVGAPTVTLTYHGSVLLTSPQTYVYAQIADASAGRVVGGLVTPIPVVLDGLTHTISRPLEVVALRGRPTSNLRLQLVASSPLYGPQRSLGSITVSSVTTSLPLVDAAATPP
ncbi:MAG: type transport system ATP-binding protein [Solirubrobacteraceae bacterium]|nr:type transport system ATP-binding protein [Solirubrobacteraceae bacterium]